MIVDNVSLTYVDKTTKVKALKNINIELPKKGIVFITGKSGSGKTTLLHIMGNLLTPTTGNILNAPKEMTNIGFIFQDNNLIDYLNVEDNIIIGSSIKDEGKIDEIAKDLKINHLIFEKLNTLSGGEKQRVAIARCLYRGNNIILADEPTSSLDESNANNIFKLLKNISTDKLVVVVTHNSDLVEKYADKEIFLKDGEVTKVIDYNLIENNNMITTGTIENKKLITKPLYISNLKQTRSITNVTSFLLSLILFTALIIFGAMVRLNSNELGLKNSYLNNDNLIYATNHTFYKDSRKEYNRIPFTENIITKTNNNNPDYYFYRLQYYDLLSNMNYGRSYEGKSRLEISLIGHNSPSGFLELEESDLQNLNIELMYGEFPRNYNEYLITDLQYYCYQRYGFGYDKVSINDFTDLDKIIFPEYEEFVISGVINTNFNTDYLNEIFKEETKFSDSSEMAHYNEIQFILLESIHNSRIVLRGFINHYYPNQIVLNRNDLLSAATILNERIAFGKIKKAKSSFLKDNEIAINFTAAMELKLIEIGYDFRIKLLEQRDKMVLDFAFDNFKEIETEFKEYMYNELGYDKDYINEYVSFMDYYYYIVLESPQENIFHPGYDLEYFNNLNEFLKLDEPIELSLSIDGEEYDLIVTSMFREDGVHDEFYFSDDLYTYFLDNVVTNTKTIITKLKTDCKSDLKLIKGSVDNGFFVKFSNRTFTHISYNDNLFKAYADYGLIAIPILLIFILLFFITLIFIRLKNNQRQIGVLLTLGYSRTKIASIYLINIIATIILAFVVSIFTSSLLISKINSILLGPITIIKYLLKVSFLNVVYPLLILLIMLTVIIALVIQKVNKLDISMMIRGE